MDAPSTIGDQVNIKYQQLELSKTISMLNQVYRDETEKFDLFDEIKSEETKAGARILDFYCSRTKVIEMLYKTLIFISADTTIVDRLSYRFP